MNKKTQYTSAVCLFRTILYGLYPFTQVDLCTQRTEAQQIRQLRTLVEKQFSSDLRNNCNAQ